MEELPDPTLQKELGIKLEINEMNEVTNQVEHLSFDDLSFDLVLDKEGAKETISKSLVFTFFAKRPVLVLCFE